MRTNAATARWGVALLGCVFCLSEAAVAQAPIKPAQQDCSSISPIVERECVGKRISMKERSLATIYQRAMRSVQRNFAHYGHWDNRSDPTYLTRSQKAWKQYVANDCTVQAAFGGGSNPSITDRQMACYEDELDKRLDLLRQLADGTFGTG